MSPGALAGREIAEEWLTHTVPGIILLGAAGSILAVGVLSALRLVPLPIRWHRQRQSEQAYMLGYSAAVIDKDDTAKRLVAYLFYHLCLMLVYLLAVLLSGVVVLIVLGLQARTALTWGSFMSSVSAFTFSYLAYFEFEYINRTYLFYWKNGLEHAKASLRKRRKDDTQGGDLVDEDGTTEDTDAQASSRKAAD